MEQLLNFSVNQPIQSPYFQQLFPLHDPTHLFKNIRNNWRKYKHILYKVASPRIIKRYNTKSGLTDLTNLYKHFLVSAMNKTKLNHETLYPDKFKRQKVPLVINVFHKKTEAALKMHKYNKNSIFENQVILLWNILNVKSPKKEMMLHDRYH